MDIVRKKTKNNNKKFSLIAVVLLAGIGMFWQLANSNPSSFIADKDSLLLDTVQRGTFEVSVRGIGVLVPKDIRWVATNVNGRVEAIHAKSGAQVKAGDVLMELSNPELVQQLEERQWELEEMQAQLHADQVSLESHLLDQETLVINSRLNYERALLTLNAQKSLLAQGFVAVSVVEHEEIKIDVEQFNERWMLEQKRLIKRQENVAAQKKAFLARLTRMQRIVARMQSQVDGLIVRASIDSIVQEMPLELGQQVNAGSNLARLAKSGEFLAELRVPEQQVSNVSLGQHVVIDTKANKVDGIVKRIEPSVNNGSVQVDVELIGEIPKEARPELSVDGIIEIAKLSDVLFVKRPMFAKQSSHSTVFSFDEITSIANLTDVEFGQVSNTHIEIKNGLSAGDRIVVSDISSWDDHQQVKLN
ncbi:HlyD family efflux transporter periplasmic adaptor subunit [Psychrosphaera sp. F3M07]|uniref:efflux RND transporter periplasmic adaptor subunit n=1 Tax=Psychrosphaera sp. F3M07 TaxID=2841560 RepID=UPI001C090A34|nr:HlyD family efflux transporter periplasmic adaptor subunit [Psychrosphaera sp. F3M07]MBU2917386.1 HlyD family efflux transporter periplasmic adaptor subunit [Psychrosphaera sp. F3M07]